MKNWKYAFYRQTGLSHGVCQGSVDVYADDTRVIACLCDGLGSLNNSDSAAQVAVKSVIEILGEYNPFRCSDVTADNLTHFKKKLISEVQRRIIQDIVPKYKDYLMRDITSTYGALSNEIRSFFKETKATNEEVLNTSRKSADEIRQKYEKSKKELEDVQSYREQLETALNAVRANTEDRVNKLCKALEEMTKTA